MLNKATSQYVEHAFRSVRVIQNGAHSAKNQENELCQTHSLTDTPAEEYNACFLGKKKYIYILFF